MSVEEEMASYYEKVGKYYTFDEYMSVLALEPLSTPPPQTHPHPSVTPLRSPAWTVIAVSRNVPLTSVDWNPRPFVS